MAGLRADTPTRTDWADDSERPLAPVRGRQRVAQGLAPDSLFTLHGVRGRVYSDVKAAKALAAKSVPFKIKKPHVPHLHLPAALGGCHLMGKHSAGTEGAAGASDVPKEKHGVAATLHVPRLHLNLPAALGGRRLARKHPVDASEGDGTTLL